MSTLGAPSFAANNLMHEMTSEHDDELERLVEKIKTTPRIKDIHDASWRLLLTHMRNLRKDKEYDKVLSIGQEILSERRDVRRLFYDELIYTLSEYHPTIEYGDLALELVKIYHEQGYLDSSRSLEIFQHLYKAVLEFGDPMLRHEYYELTRISPLPTSKRTVSSIYENLSLLFVASGSLEGALDVIEEAAHQEHLLSLHLNELVFLALVHVGDLDYSMEMILRMQGKGPIYARTWGLFISEAARQRYWPALEWAYKMAVVPGNVVLDDCTYERLMEAAATHGKFVVVQWLLIRGQRRLGNPSNTTAKASTRYYIPLIEAHAKAGNVRQAFEIVERMNENAIFVQHTDLPLLSEALTARQGLMIAAELYGALCTKKDASDAVKTLLMNLILRATSEIDKDATVKLYRECLDYDVPPDGDTMVILLTALNGEVDPLFVQEIYSDCNRLRIAISKKLHTATVTALEASGYMETAELYVSERQQQSDSDSRNSS